MVMRITIYFLILAFVATACSSGKKALEEGNYLEAIEKAVNRLGNDASNRKARQVLTEGYPLAMEYYQEEIDRTLSSNDRFKWGITLDIMERINKLSNLVRRVPAARKLIPSPKMYTSELNDVRERAAEERYQAGLMSIERPGRESAKNAYFHFREADRLVPSFKDALEKMKLAKEKATIHVVIEPIPIPSKRYELSADFFYNQVIERMNQKFPQQSFVNLYTPEEAEQANLNYPNMLVVLEFYDFFVGKMNRYEEERVLTRDMTEKVPVKVGNDSVRYETRTFHKQGKIRVITDEVASAGILNVKIEEFQTKKLLLEDRIPGEFIWRNQYGIFVGDEEVLTDHEINILNNSAVLPPPSQDLFIEFTRPIYIRLTDRLTSFFKRHD